ncbi:hypothetical protein ElyMa_006997900 [Elysia marginata]|uniref:Uncharacterized protein n=1 Tax=Elysia marginata TaxID=1093978 RepID=A0AAV4JTI4_9GAST|nr:hypothetical protein ElyMa_006997900 [Elysia marginata]
MSAVSQQVHYLLEPFPGQAKKSCGRFVYTWLIQPVSIAPGLEQTTLTCFDQHQWEEKQVRSTLRLLQTGIQILAYCMLAKNRHARKSSSLASKANVRLKLPHLHIRPAWDWLEHSVDAALMFTLNVLCN